MTPRSRTNPAAVVVVLAASLFFEGRARAAEYQMSVAAGGLASSWRADGSANGALKLGFRFADIVGVYALGRVGYGTVDERMLTMLQLGGQLWLHAGPVRPYARLGLIHAHEETMASVKAEPFGALFGVGDGIRHRAGGELALGLDWPFHESGSLQWFAGGEAAMTWFPDPRGPNIYGGGSLSLGFNYKL